MLPFLTPLLGLLGKGIDAALDWKKNDTQKILGEQQIQLNEQQLDFLKQKLKADMQRFVIENSNQVEKDFRSFVVDYEGSAEDVPKAIQILRGIIRPLLTIWGTVMITWLMLGDQDNIAKVSSNLDKIPSEIWWIFLAIFSFWFGGRAVQQVIDKRVQGDVQQKREEAKATVQAEEERTKQEAIKVRKVAPTSDLPEDDFTQEELIRSKIRRGPNRLR